MFKPAYLSALAAIALTATPALAMGTRPGDSGGPSGSSSSSGGVFQVPAPGGIGLLGLGLAGIVLMRRRRKK